MSNQTNDNLLTEADFYLDYFTGTIMEKLISHDIQTNDLEQLKVHVNEARETAWKLEYHPTPMAERIF